MERHELRPHERTAVPSAWKTRTLPARRASVTLDRVFSQEDMDRIHRGVVPETMDDKWFIYWTEGALYFHRSWTGFCIYVVHFAAEGDVWRMLLADVNRDPRQYEETDTDRDARLIASLIDVLLLHRHVAFPPAGSPRASALANWGVVGRAMMGRHPGDGTS